MCKLVEARLGKRRLKLWGPEDRHIVGTMRRSGRWYESDLLLVIKGLGIDGVFVDVGANIGSHTVAFHDACGAQRVIAIEPHEQNLRYLKKNAVGRRVRVVPTAVSCEKDTLRLDVPVSFDPQGYVLVEPDTIDDVLANVGERDVALIKIDVAKHYGFDALKSAARTISRCLPVIVVEACEQDEHEAIKGWLAAQSYVELGCYAATPTYLYVAEGP